MTPVLEAAAQVTRTSTGEEVLFWILGPLAVLAALGMVFSRKAVHSALCLAWTMMTLAMFYLAQDAPFLGVVQIVVYTGAVMMLFLFVLMIVGVDSSDSLVETIRGQRWAAILLGGGLAVLLLGALGKATIKPMTGLRQLTTDKGGNIPGLAELVFTRYVFAFEVTSALLITAALGAMLLAHHERFHRKATQHELSRQRFQPGGRATPKPMSGVYARHNAVDTPALLPDGTPLRDSVPAALSLRDDEHRARPAELTGAGQDMLRDGDGRAPE